MPLYESHFLVQKNCLIRKKYTRVIRKYLYSEMSQFGELPDLVWPKITQNAQRSKKMVKIWPLLWKAIALVTQKLSTLDIFGPQFCRSGFTKNFSKKSKNCNFWLKNDTSAIFSFLHYQKKKTKKVSRTPEFSNWCACF